jgi:hypothetical protein
MLIESGIKELHTGDIDDDGYDDIIIWTQDNQLRAYNNEKGIIDVDGMPLCLDIPGGPDDLGGLVQLFVKDMDLDGAVDIITNDNEGAIQIFYGGKDSPYLSRDPYLCDDQWLDRLTDESLLVTQVGIELHSDPVYDNSLVHRKGLTYAPGSAGSQTFSEPSSSVTNNLPASIGSILAQQTTVDIDDVVQESLGDAYRFIASPMRFVPPYETSLTYKDMYYVPLYSQRTTDPIAIHKTYTDHNGGVLLSGDRVTVTVTAKANNATTITFMDYGV